MSKVNVYVDCFNLYYGCLKDTRYKWLNIAELVRQELPTVQVHRLRLFLAQVAARPGDPDLPMRQQTSCGRYSPCRTLRLIGAPT